MDIFGKVMSLLLFFFILKIILFIYSLLAVLALCCSGSSLVAVNGDYSLTVVPRLLTAVVSLCSMGSRALGLQ